MKRFYSKRKKFAPNGSRLYPFWVNLISDTWNYLSVSHFRRDLTCWKRNSKSQKLSPVSKMAENLPSVSSPLKPSATCSIWTGPSRSKLTMLLVNISLKVWSFKMAFLKKKKKNCKSYSLYFSKNTCALDIVLSREMPFYCQTTGTNDKLGFKSVQFILKKILKVKKISARRISHLLTDE